MRPFGYCRVSNKDQVEGFSLDAQERAIRAYCAERGWDAPIIYADRGRSGYSDVTAKRPEFARMLNDAEQGGADVIVTHKLDRFARSLLTTLRELKRLQDAGVAFVALSERDHDFTTPMGRLFLVIIAGLAEYFSGNLSTEVKKGLVERKLSGAPPHSRPYGAVVEDNALVVDPDKAEHLARILELAATRSYEDAADMLNAARVPARRAPRWSARGVINLVSSAGWLAHQPAPWPSRYLAAATRRAVAPVRRGRRVRDLTGLMRCGVCGGVICYGGAWAGGDTGLQCRRTVRDRKGCLPDAPRKTGASHYETHVAAWVAALPEDRYLLDAAARLAGADDPALAALAAVAVERRRLRLQHDAGLVADAAMLAAAAALTARERAVAPAARRVAEYALEIAAARRAYPALPPEARNTILRALVQSVEITGRGCVVVPLPELARLLCEARNPAAAA